MQQPTNLWVVDASRHRADMVAQPSANQARRWARAWYLHYKLFGALILAVVFICVGSWYGHVHQPANPLQKLHTGKTANSASSTLYNTTYTSSNTSSNHNVVSPQSVTVDVIGDVQRPGLVHVSQNARVFDVVKAAGGFRRQGDAALVNQAALVYDGEEVDVPVAENTDSHRASASTTKQEIISTQEQVPATATTPSATSLVHRSRSRVHATSTASAMRIDLNTADAATLETLPGLGPKRASEIISYRQTHGPFISLTDLLKVRGVGRKTLEKWSPLLFVNSSTSTAADLNSAR